MHISNIEKDSLKLFLLNDISDSSVFKIIFCHNTNLSWKTKFIKIVIFRHLENHGLHKLLTLG